MMCMRLRLSVDFTAAVLTDLYDKLEDCLSGDDARDVRDRWLRWWSEADAQLRILFGDGDVAASLYVLQLRVRDVNLDTMPYGLLRHEIDVWLDRFTEMVDELAGLSSFIERPGLIVGAGHVGVR